MRFLVNGIGISEDHAIRQNITLTLQNLLSQQRSTKQILHQMLIELNRPEEKRTERLMLCFEQLLSPDKSSGLSKFLLESMGEIDFLLEYTLNVLLFVL